MIVWLASYPRSGNTFVRLIMRSTFGLSSYSVYGDPRDIGSDEATAEIVGHIDQAEDLDLAAMRASSDIHLIKTHEYPGDVEADDRVIYTIRDGRESLVSYKRYLADFGVGEYSHIDIAAGLAPFGRWARHVEEWSPKTRANTLLLRYEDLVGDPAAGIEQIAAFLDLEGADAALPTFDALQESNDRFFRSGQTASWKTALSDEEKMAFECLSAQRLAEYGYSLVYLEPFSEQYRMRFHRSILALINAARTSILPPPSAADQATAAGTGDTNAVDAAAFYIVSYPRSGNTWTVNSLQMYLGAQRAELLPSVYGGDEITLSSGVTVKTAGAFEPHLPVGIKTHHYKGDFMREQLPPMKVLYVMRDVRDVLTSYYFYVHGFMGQDESKVDEFDVGHFAEFLKENVVHWRNHVSGWQDSGLDVLVVQYESLKADYVAKLKEISTFLDLPPVCSETEVEDRFVTNFREIDQFKQVLQGDNKDFYRKGVVGDWKNYFNKECETLIREQAGEVMTRFGYEW